MLQSGFVLIIWFENSLTLWKSTLILPCILNDFHIRQSHPYDETSKRLKAFDMKRMCDIKSKFLPINELQYQKYKWK